MKIYIIFSNGFFLTSRPLALVSHFPIAVMISSLDAFLKFDFLLASKQIYYKSVN